MKLIIMLTIVLSAFFMFSCGGDDDDNSSSGGITQSEFYKNVAVQTCEKGFECDIEFLKMGKTDIAECKDETSQDTCTHEFNGVKAKECNDCMETVTCEEYSQDAGTSKCPVCNEVCTL